jgi:hypothetical protein
MPLDTIWKVASVERQPSLTLVRWSILQTDTGARHLCGYCIENREGRVSTAVTRFDPSTLRCDTASGRVYQLEGAPGYDADAEHVWGYWAKVNSVKSWRDVTAEVVAQAAT